MPAIYQIDLFDSEGLFIATKRAPVENEAEALKLASNLLSARQERKTAEIWLEKQLVRRIVQGG